MEEARAGAPDAIEVADRWHLRLGLAEAVEKTVAAHHHFLKKEPELEPEPSIERAASEQLRMVAEQVHATRQESSILAVAAKNRFQAVTALKNEGMGIKKHHTATRLARETVRRFYCANSVDELLGAPWAGRPTMLDKFAVHLHERFNDGCISATALYEELRALGYRGSYSSVRDYSRPLRTIGAAPARKQVLQGPSDRLLDVASPKTTSPTTTRSDGGRSSPAAGTSKQLQDMSSVEPLPCRREAGAGRWLRVRPTDAAVRALFVSLRPPNGALSSAGIPDIVRRRADAAGLGVVHAHRLRHTAASTRVYAGAGLDPAWGRQ